MSKRPPGTGLPDTFGEFIKASELSNCPRCGDAVHPRYIENGVCVGCRYGGGRSD